MELWQALVLGIVEGLTEFVPVSSTGHLILVSRALGIHGEAANAYSVVIQLGALLAAVFYYRETLLKTATGLWQKEPAAQKLLVNLMLGSLPLLILGYAFGKRIKAALFAPGPVALALLVGGLVMLLMDRLQQKRQDLLQSAAELSPGRALLVGLLQALALWPGTSRSMVSIAGGQLVRLSTAAAADFAFLLALPTLGAATLYELRKEGPLLLSAIGAPQLALGLVVSFVVGLLVISGFLRYLRRYGLWPFGLYRIALAAILWHWL